MSLSPQGWSFALSFSVLVEASAKKGDASNTKSIPPRSHHLSFFASDILSRANSIQAIQKGETSMFARVTTVQIQPGAADDLTRYLNEVVVPAAKQSHGFGGIQALVNPATNTGIAITFWDSEADMVAGESSTGYYTQALARAARFLAGTPTREAYEVRIKE
jgi:heme-degrading monooxygenase HmoA